MDLTVEYVDIRDDTRFQRDGSTLAVKRVTFYIGKHGPFVENVPTDGDWHAELSTRVNKLKTQLATLPG